MIFWLDCKAIPAYWLMMTVCLSFLLSIHLSVCHFWLTWLTSAFKFWNLLCNRVIPSSAVFCYTFICLKRGGAGGDALMRVWDFIKSYSADDWVAQWKFTELGWDKHTVRFKLLGLAFQGLGIGILKMQFLWRWWIKRNIWGKYKTTAHDLHCSSFQQACT